MIIVYLNRIGAENADVSYNTAWEGLWAFAEISFGLTVTGAFSLPKFIEAKGTMLRGFFSNLTRPFTSLTSGGPSGIIMQSRNNTTAPQEATQDTVTMIGGSESSSTHCDHDIERYPYGEGIQESASYPSVNTKDASHRF